MDAAARRKAFEDHYGIRIPVWWERGPSVVENVSEARAIAERQFASIAEYVVETEPTFGVMIHLCDRAYEHVAGSIVCFATGNGTTAEVAHRVAMEAATNIRFILQVDRNSRFISWLREYVERDGKEISKWEIRSDR